MRILLTCPSLSDHGGVAGYYRSVLPYLQDGDTHITVLEIGSTASRGGLLHPLLDMIRFFLMLCIKRIDLVHINPSLNLKSFIRDGLFIVIARLRGKKVLVFFRGWQKSFERDVRYRYRLFFWLTYGRADACVVLGQSFADRLREWGVQKPIFLETTAVDDRLLHGFSIAKKTGIFNGRVVKLLFLSSLLKEKGIYELLEAVRRLREKKPGLLLTVAGDGPELGRIQAMVKDPAWRQAVSLSGYVSGADKMDALAMHHIFCFPSWDEGLPNCLLEAMAFGLPVIATPVGAIPDFFIEGKMGCLVPVRDPPRLALAIEEMAADITALGRMARFNHEYAVNRFRASLVTERLRKIYSQTLYGVHGE